jgi:hypothetical protein
MLTGKSLFLSAALAATLAAGCADDDADRSTSARRDRDRDGIADRYDRRPDRASRRDDDVILSRDRISDRDRLSDRDRVTLDLRGLSEIPRDAKRVDEARTGEPVRYTALNDGRVYLYDEVDDRVVYSGKVYRDEAFVADPERDMLSVNGKRLADVNLRAGHAYRLYFLRN